MLSSTNNPLFDANFNRVTALLTGSLSPVMRADLGSSALFAGFLFPVMNADLGPSALFACLLLPVMDAYLTSFALPALIFVFSVFAKIFQIMRCSGFDHISYFFFHFIKQKNLNSFWKIFSKHKISDFSQTFAFLKNCPFY